MENKQSPSKNKLISIQEEKLIREVDYDSIATQPAHLSKKPYLLDLEIFPKTSARRQYSQKVLVSVKPRNPKSIQSLFIAEKSRFHSKKGSSILGGSRLAIGDHSSITTHLSENDFNVMNSIGCGQENLKQKKKWKFSPAQQEFPPLETKCSVVNTRKSTLYNDKPRSAEKCYIYSQVPLNMNLPKLEAKVDSSTVDSNKVDIATLIITNTSFHDSEHSATSHTLSKLNKRIEHLERKIMKQEMVFRSIDPHATLSSSDEDTTTKENTMKSSSATGRPGCSYIQQYSHVPETSAFQRYAHQAAPLSPSKATTIEKEHNSEQYGRDFTTYDGITARGRRQCASVPCKRDDIPKLAAERVHKIRHKLNPVRDYRLMDTVHYLAQGEFAPRDDGIKLTPSREAVLSDIIWEDVCRTHWPNTRLGRRLPHPERCNTRCELQRLIDSLLRERVAHVERRRRRHYRIVKLNHRHESCRPVGKTGDIIVASHKNRHGSEDKPLCDLNAGSAMIPVRNKKEHSPRRNHASHDRFYANDMRPRHNPQIDDSSPGPSHAATRSHTSREPTCCYHTSTNPATTTSDCPSPSKIPNDDHKSFTSTSSVSGQKQNSNSPRLVVKKEKNRRKHLREEPDLEHYIVLPTLVVRTPSNMKRQKKFNELYHKILNVQINNAQKEDSKETIAIRETPENPKTKDIGFNINIILSNSAENFNHLD